MSSIVQGRYSELGEPLLTLSLHGHEGQHVILDALVDTGFNRGLLIFENDAEVANLPHVDRVSADRMRLADGTIRAITPTTGYVTWFGQLTQMEIAVVRAERGNRDRCLIGMELLRGTDILLGKERFEIRTN